MPERYRHLKKERLTIIRTLDLLIIDEISMVRADLLDAVDMSLRTFRRSDKPFGGVQLLMIGDAHQLSPVVKENEQQYMAQVYPSPYFFHSKALQKLGYITIELQKVHRQKDADFLEILNAVREDRITQGILQKLNSRVGAFDSDGDVIRLTTHNHQADEVNASKHAELPGKPSLFDAEIEGEFPENSYPADSVLSLKKVLRSCSSEMTRKDGSTTESSAYSRAFSLQLSQPQMAIMIHLQPSQPFCQKCSLIHIECGHIR